MNADSVGLLVHSAGARAVPEADRIARARQRVHAAWRDEVDRRLRAKRFWLAAAALVVAAVALRVTQLRVPASPVQVASVTRIAGQVIVQSAGQSQATPAAVAQTLVVGDVLASSNTGRVLMQWLRNADVRLDTDSAVRFRSTRELELLRGAVYVETLAGVGGRAEITVTTAAGRVQHIGTQFEVRMAGGNLRVRVREGSAVFSDPERHAVKIEAGQQLVISGERIALEPGPSPSDASWDWTLEVAPEVQIEGRSLFEVLDRLGRESGLRIHYENDAVLARARSIHLHGRTDGLKVRDTLQVVLAGSGLEFSLQADRVEIYSARAR